MPSSWTDAVEATATACNLLANAVVLRCVCRDVRGAVPLPALALQIGANLAWMAFALARRDRYLFATAAAGFGMQLTSATLRWRDPARRTATDRRARRPIRLDTSDPELPRM